MPKYLFTGSYTELGGKGLMAEGGSKRLEAVTSLFASLGGRLESFHFAFGGDDYFIIGELPDNATAAAASLKVGTSGAVRNRTVVLMTPDELDRAAGVQVSYRPPGA